MRKNEYVSLDEFRSQYIGVWAPSEGHWLGLDFSYKGNEYRFQTGSMYAAEDTILPDGRAAVYGLYHKNNDIKASQAYDLLAEFATMDDVLISTYSAGLQLPEIDLPECSDVLLLDKPRRKLHPFILEFTHDLLPVIPEMNHAFHIPVTIVFQQRHHLPGSSSWSLSGELLSA